MVDPNSRNIVVVLHQVRSPDNLGAVARLCANFGISKLVLSDPVTYAFRAAEKLAVGAGEILESMQVVKDLRAALTGCTFACGTTSRHEIKGRSTSEPEVAIARLKEHATRGPVALVFGGEKRGLSDEELALCQDILAIPTDPRQPSMNLSQAAAVLLYLGSRTGRPPSPKRTEPVAPLRLLQKVESNFDRALRSAGFLNPQAPERILRELMRSLERQGLTRREAELWCSATEQLASSRRGGPTPH